MKRRRTSHEKLTMDADRAEFRYAKKRCTAGRTAMEEESVCEGALGVITPRCPRGGFRL